MQPLEQLRLMWDSSELDQGLQRWIEAKFPTRVQFFAKNSGRKKKKKKKLHENKKRERPQ